MQDMEMNKLQGRATESLIAEIETRAASRAVLDQVRKLEARAIIDQQIKTMKEEGRAFELSEEEIKMLESFRRFKVRMRKDGEIFTWQTRRPEGVQIVEDTAEIIHPSEV